MILIRARFQNHIYDDNFTKGFEKGGLTGHVDIPRMSAGKYGGAFWSAFLPCPKNNSDYSDEAYAPSTFIFPFHFLLGLKSLDVRMMKMCVFAMITFLQLNCIMFTDGISNVNNERVFRSAKNLS
jgi:hypothetical protein